MKPKKVCILVRNYVERDPRVNRQIRWLAEAGKYRITVIGFGDGPVHMQGVDKIITFKWQERSLFGKFASAPGLFLNNFLPFLAKQIYWSTPFIKEMYAAALEEKHDIFHANDWDTLPLAVAAANKSKNARVIYDSHEFATLEFEESWKFNLFYKNYRAVLENEYIKRAHVVITVSHLIADQLEKRYGVKCKVIMNCPEFEEMTLNIPDPENIKLCHHGGYHPSRGIEELIKCLSYLDQRYSLHFRLICTQKVMDKLQKLAGEVAPGRVYFHPVVKPHEIVRTVNQYDLGVYALKPVNFNSRAALPNKFYEFIMAGLCLCIGPLPEMKRIVEEYGCGVVARGFDAHNLAERIGTLSVQKIVEYKRRSLEAARVLNAQVEGEKFRKIYEKL